MYTKGPGRPKKKRKGLSNPKENVSKGSFVLICKYCGIESSQSSKNVITIRQNLLNQNIKAKIAGKIL